ncbi:MAG: putative baseplate assembly protein [Actinomycetota bacterium]|nr:putative baseplate assembly protein [Actinomycetota bacterium]HSH23637.1 putative baseplate assembly protein [Acidimicrobiales bacterium]
MTLPAPNLDDRRFQDLVDDAKRLVMQRCPEWTDHNVSDPGVTLIETFAFVADQVLYRLNRVPDRLYVKFLELIGVRLLPPTPARAPVTFWLSAPARAPIAIPTGTKVATVRSESEDPVVFSTCADLAIVPCALQHAGRLAAADEFDERSEDLRLGVSFAPFSPVPAEDDVLLIGLTEAVPSCALRLEFRCHVEGVGVDPDHPPLVWEAWGAGGWLACDVDHDTTGGLNRDGEVVLHVPAGHEARVLDGRRAGWVRARVVAAEAEQPAYSSSPVIHGMAAGTIGGTVDVVHADIVENEPLGVSEGVPGQRFRVSRAPVLAGAGAPVLDVSSPDGWEEWAEVGDFGASSAEDRHFLLDAVNGEVAFGPAVRDADGALRSHGAVPPRGAYVRMRSYTTGGGRRGNVSRGAIRTLKSSIPFVSAVENRRAAQGGVDGEDIESAKARGPIQLRTRARAVTAEDFEQLTREAAPEVARVRCVPAGDQAEAGTVKVLIVPAAPSVRGNIRFEDLLPAEQTFERVRERLDAARLIGTRVVIEPPLYRGVTVVARLKARRRASAARVSEDALEQLDCYLNPLTGGPEGRGWPWGRPVQAGEIFAVLQSVSGVDLVEDVRVFGANPVTGERGPQCQRLEFEPHSLAFSYNHQLRVEEA